jgi:hypothetical protein
MEGTDYTIVGVAPTGLLRRHGWRRSRFFGFLSQWRSRFRRAGMGWTTNGFNRSILIARLKPGVSVAQAAANTNLVFKQIHTQRLSSANPRRKKKLPASNTRRSS